MFGYIYVTTNLINGKKYVGKHVSSTFDFAQHKGSGKILKKAFDKYGFENFSCQLIPQIGKVNPICNSLEELNNTEMYYISELDCINSDNYYNVRNGGDGGDIYSHLSDVEKQHRNITISNKNKGYCWISNISLQKSMRINRNDFINYEKDGWIVGYKFKKNPNTQTPKYKERIKVQTKSYPLEILNAIEQDYISGLSCSECSKKYNINELWIRKYLQRTGKYEKRGNTFYMQQPAHRSQAVNRQVATKKLNYKFIPRDDIWKSNIKSAVRKTKGRSVYCVELDKVFSSIAEANEFLGKAASCDNIGACCRKYAAGKIDAKAFNLHWRYIK